MPDIQQIYESAKQAEDTLFQVSPVPLSMVKTGIQNVGVPLAVSAVATHTPFIAPVAGAAIHLGGEAFQGVTHHLAQQAMTSFGQSVMEGLPHTMGVQSAYGAISNVVGDVVLAGQDMATQAIGTAGTAIMLGRTVANSAVLTFQKVRPMTINEILANGQKALQRSQRFLVESAKHVRNLGLKAEQFVQQEVNKLNNNQEQKQEATQSQNGHKQAAPETVVSASKTKIEPETPKAKQKEESKQNLKGDSEKQTPEPVLKQPAEVIKEGIPELLTQTGDPDRNAMDYFQKLASELGGRNLNTEKMKIFFDGQEVFRLSKGQPDLNHTIVTDQQMAAFKEALADPTNFKGTLEIKQGSKILLSIKNGQVYDPMNKIQDLISVKMTQGETQAPETTTQGFYQRYSEGVKAQGLEGAAQIAKAALNSGNHTQAEIVSMLVENNPTIKRTAQQKGTEAAQRQAETAIKRASRQNLMQSPEVKQQQAQQQELQQSQTVSQKL